MKTVRRRIRLILAWTVAVVTLVYGSGDYFGWWDGMSGRADASKGVARMGSTRGLGETLLCSGDHEFHALWRFILRRSENPEISKLAVQNIVPDCMTSVGGGEQIVPLPPEWPQSARLVGHSPVIVMYNAERTPKGGYRGRNGKSAYTHWAARLDDISRWINESRENERFIVMTVVLGLLSIALLVFDDTRD